MECIYIKVTGSGSVTLPAGVSFPGAYKATDAGVLFDLYNSFSSYPIPGPKVFSGTGSGSAPAVTTKAPAAATSKAATPATSKAAVTTAKPAATPIKATTLATVAKPSPTTGSGAVGTVQRWGQCGGKGYTGATGCVSGTKCQKQNDYYSQCL